MFLLTFAKGPRAQIIGFEGPNTINVIVVGPYYPIIWVLGPLGFWSQKKGLGLRVGLFTCFILKYISVAFLVVKPSTT